MANEPFSFDWWTPCLSMVEGGELRRRHWGEPVSDPTSFDLPPDSPYWREQWRIAVEPDEIPDNERLGRHADQTIRRMIREEIAREKEDLPIRPYPEKEHKGN